MKLLKLLSVAALSAASMMANAAGVDALSGLLKNVETFTANFTQTMRSQSGQVLQEVTGTLKAKRPGLFFWKTRAPLEQTIVTDGQQVWIYDPDLEQVTIQHLSQQLSNTPALLLSGEVGKIDEQYQVEQQPESQPGQVDFLLRPKGVDSLFDTLQLSFVNDQLVSMKLKDSLGQQTSLFFTAVSVNQTISEKAFHFEIPDGVDVIREAP
ncbi:outer membrane lipoprotein carrier protein LolA [Hahella chejuensis KCTC 2396]|uniref:Outer-membrane lipoprotein carrier protein n=1 Tax=Hahella chejuensis (strain KCTC 2396) TaxID=349521 RepID=LOLA_HAHCH|nr:outer membrane lipoprotein chaperone LolA [Hahella chejuensis]Q2SJC1.1 RecName: Full=Outer-membrane lipoprotein carrier protein; Flags: Precursor [Hahella chejuensis KCTC 2396]ABC29253.1 outer membrane lipoprotein carrier protein LolA [Hahella chejuensis KCTC 2396]